MLVPHQQRCTYFCVLMTLVTVITHWKWKNQNNNHIKSFDTTNNSIDNIDEDNNDNDFTTNECLDVIKSNNNNMNKTKDEIINMLHQIM